MSIATIIVVVVVVEPPLDICSPVPNADKRARLSKALHELHSLDSIR
jgi:hypothetical protein